MIQSLKIQENINQNWLSSQFSLIRDRFPFLHYLAIAHAVAFLISTIAILLDDRQLTGINIWIKPSKFILSTIILLWTLGWYLLNYPFKEKTKTFIAYAMTFLLTLENILISMQAYRGVKSHYNIETFFDAKVFGMMGFAIGLITMLVAWILIKSFSSKFNFSNSMVWGFRIAWIAFLFGSAAGGGAMIEQHAHTVGMSDGEAGLPYLNWSTLAGDYRVAHFLGLHAIQIIPLTIYLIHRSFKNQNLATRLSIGFAILFLVGVVFVYYQAKMGSPFIKV
jgi:hypothetical protein